MRSRKKEPFLWIPSGLKEEKLNLRSLYFPTTQLLPRVLLCGEQEQAWEEYSSSMSGGEVVELSDGWASWNGIHLDEANHLLAGCTESWAPIGVDHPLFALRWKRRKWCAQRTEKNLLSLTGKQTHNYFHWLYDVLPRIFLAEEAGIPFDQFWVDASLPYQRETLHLLGYSALPLEQARPGHWISSKRMWVPSFPLMRGEVPFWALRFLQQRLGGGEKGDVKRIYISRQDANRRRLLREEEHWPLLEKAGFRRVTLAGRSFLEQAALFRGAHEIIAPHGAALANLLFCSPGTRLVELFPNRYPYPCFRHLASLCGIAYLPCMGQSICQKGGGEAVADDLDITNQQLDSALSWLQEELV